MVAAIDLDRHGGSVNRRYLVPSAGSDAATDPAPKVLYQEE